MIKEEFAALVKDKREEKGMSQQDLAEKTGISKDTIKNIENKKQNVFLEQALRIAAALEFDVNDVVLP